MVFGPFRTVVKTVLFRKYLNTTESSDLSKTCIDMFYTELNRAVVVVTLLRDVRVRSEINSE